MNRPRPPRRFNGYAKLEHGSAWVSMQANEAGHYVEHQDYAELVAYANYLEQKELEGRMRQQSVRNALKRIDPLLVESIDSALLAEKENL
jgi:hypothetical protein